MTELSPAILTNDVSDFRKKYAELLPLNEYFTKLHVDFADGLFVPSKTLMPGDLRFIQSGKISLIAHLMMLNPKAFFEDLKQGHFEWVLVHYEAFSSDEDLQDALNTAERMELKIGLVINPSTVLTKIAKFIYRVKLIQIMGVEPGAQGQQFIPGTIEKVRELRSLSKPVIISVDGGVKIGIAGKLAKAGADILVVGSAILASEDPSLAMEAMKFDIEFAK